MQWFIKQTINLNSGEEALRAPQSISPIAYPGNVNAHIWQVTVKGAPDGFHNASASAYFMRKDGNTVLVHGTIEGNVASVTFPSAIYAIPGPVKATMDITKDGQTLTAASLSFVVQENMTDSIIDPGEAIPGIDDVVAEYANMRAAVSAAETATAAANLAASHAVRYDAGQTLTVAEQKQARDNIGVSQARVENSTLIIW